MVQTCVRRVPRANAKARLLSIVREEDHPGLNAIARNAIGREGTGEATVAGKP